MDKLIYTAFNTVNNIYDNRSVRAQNLANIAVPGYRRDLGAKSVGTAFLENFDTLQSRAMAVQDDTNYFSTQLGTLSETGADTDIAIRGDGYFIVQGLGQPSLSRRGDLRVNAEGILENGTSQKMLDAALQPAQDRVVARVLQVRGRIVAPLHDQLAVVTRLDRDAERQIQREADDPVARADVGRACRHVEGDGSSLAHVGPIGWIGPTGAPGSPRAPHAA